MPRFTSLASSTKRNRCPICRSTRHARYAGSTGRQWPPTPGPGREAHEAVRLRRGRVDRRPDVDVETAREHRELVDQRDVDVPERVLEQLHELGLAGGADRHDLVDERAVERLDDRQRRGVEARHDLGRVHERPLACCRDRCARASSRGRSRRRRRAGPLSSRIGRSNSSVVPGYVVDSSTTSAPGVSHAREVARGRLDEREVGDALAQRRLHGDHRDVEVAEVVGVVRRAGSRPPARPRAASSGTSST